VERGPVILGGSPLSTCVLTRIWQLVLPQDNDSHESRHRQSSSKFALCRLRKGVLCSFLTICVLARTTHKITSRTMMLTVLAAEFGSYQCRQRWSKLEKSWAFGNYTGSGHYMREDSELVEMVSIHHLT
jgi:hypothetical protein